MHVLMRQFRLFYCSRGNKSSINLIKRAPSSYILKVNKDDAAVMVKHKTGSPLQIMQREMRHSHLYTNNERKLQHHSINVCV